jgi:hypothetical protein
MNEVNRRLEPRCRMRQSLSFSQSLSFKCESQSELELLIQLLEVRRTKAMPTLRQNQEVI